MCENLYYDIVDFRKIEIEIFIQIIPVSAKSQTKDWRMENKKIIYSTKTPPQTKKIGGLLAKTVLEAGSATGATVLLLRGELGAGKTQFVQGFAKGLGISDTVNSPTFTIMKKYPVTRPGDFKYLYHIDCYRLDSGRDLAELGIDGILADPTAIVAMEWPSVAENQILFKSALEVVIDIVGASERKITFEY